MAFKIYTKTGDKGQTSLIGGTRVPKYHIRIEAYGTVDELNSHIGLLRSQDIDKEIIEVLITIQDRLFTLGSRLAEDSEKSKMKLPDISESDVTLLENEIDKMDSQMQPIRSFVLPGGNTIISYCHIARCVCRRAERAALLAYNEYPFNEEIIKYLNRLSDYLFTLSRYLSQKLDVQEIAWKAKI